MIGPINSTPPWHATVLSPESMRCADLGCRFSSRTRPVLDYFLYRPNTRKPAQRLFVTVHGVSRNAQEHIELFRDYADRHGVMLLAPLFDAGVFRDFQRLGRNGSGPRADLALIRLLNEISMQIGVDTSTVDLFGFSGGAQFAHRFAFAHSQRVRRLSLGASGWYTMPDDSLSYPYGTADAKGLDAVHLNPVAATRLPTLVLVGEYDDRDDGELNRSSVVRIRQGQHRLQRAQTWTTAMKRFAQANGSPGVIFLQVLPRIGHSFRHAVLEGGLADRVFAHHFAQPLLLDPRSLTAAGRLRAFGDQQQLRGAESQPASQPVNLEERPCSHEC